MLESRYFSVSYLINLKIDLDGIWYGVEMCWMDIIFIYCCLVNIQGRELYLDDFFRKIKTALAYFQTGFF